jgi:hypothetical protein
MTLQVNALSWPRQLVADIAIRGSERFLTAARRDRHRPRLALALLWVSDRCGEFVRRVLAERN